MAHMHGSCPCRDEVVDRLTQEFGPPHRVRSIDRWCIPQDANLWDAISVVLHDYPTTRVKLWVFDPRRCGMIASVCTLDSWSLLEAEVDDLRRCAEERARQLDELRTTLARGGVH